MSCIPDVDLSNVLNETVLEVYKKSKFRNQSRYDIFKGGAGSGKSRFIAQKILYRIIYQPNHRYLIIRKVKDTMKLSVFQLFKDYIYSWGVESKFHITESPMKITHKHSGNTINFMGVDKPEKLKSIEKITSIWIEEASELEEADFNELNRRLRGKLPNYKQIHISFNPISHLHWLKKRFFDSPPDDCNVIETTYLDNPELPEEDVRVLLEMKQYDIQQYNIYALNQWGVINTNIIHHRFNPLDHLSTKTTKDFYHLSIGIDFNIGGCVGVVFGEDNYGYIHAVDEFCVYDTEEIITELKSKYSAYTLELYPDATGTKRATSSTTTDIAMLRDEFSVTAPKSNGSTQKRYNAVNRKFMTGTLLINKDKCTKTYAAYQTHAYLKNGQPEKFTDHEGGAIDDYTDAGDYCISRMFPIEITGSGMHKMKKR